MSGGWERREVLKWALAGAAAGGLAGCEKRIDILAADVVAPPDIVPGMPSLYSSASVLDGYGSGLMVRHQDGRPIKVEGNPDHPASLGATDVFAQAMLLSFYDPARDRAPARNGQPAGWGRFKAEVRQRKTKGLRILSGSSSSPSLAAQISALGARWHRWDAVSRDNARAGAVLAFGRMVDAVPDLAKADVIFAIDSDLLSSAPGHLRYARDFAARRNPTRSDRMNRLYAVESTPTLTGVAADHRFIAGPREIHAVLQGLASDSPSDAVPPWLAGVIADLKSHRGRALVHIGPDQPAEAHAVVHAANHALDAPVQLLPPAIEEAAPLAELVEDMRSGKVETLLILDGNPVFTAPPALEFKEALSKVAFSVSLSPDLDETGASTLWWIPAAHPFEAWGDVRAFDGTVSLIQPQAMPLHGGRSAAEVLALLAGEEKSDGQALLKRFWRDRMSDPAWHDALATGVVANSTARPIEMPIRPPPALPPPPSAPLTLLFRPDPHLWDGRFAGNGWLEELPRPFTKLTWDNPLLIGPLLAKRRGLANGDLVKIGTVEGPVWIQPGQAEDCVTALFGGGRGGAGFDYYPLRGKNALNLEKTGRRYDLASTEHHTPIAGQGDGLARHATLAQFEADPAVLRGKDSPVSLYEKFERSETAWGMSIDLNACIGCNACVIACQAENNIPVVGKDQVLHQREMHWLRIDRYYGDEEIDWQPVLCMHCEEAPCEVVCPVGATVHDAEGLNVMVYNRCIGTRFCSNNCPYKVRRFNYLAYSAEEARTPDSRNPEVTVRGRGVMEKCTFCLQRVAAARIQADIENRPVRDGEIVTACQAACPTQAFTFGDLRDPKNAVAQRKASPLTYPLLGELNTRPRVTYEGKIRNKGEES